MSCTQCADELDHCHGTLIAHLDGAAECTDACADPDPARHPATSPCGVLGECRCTELVELVPLRRAS
jgi:hypothetical protein